jgi:PKD repeat protein
MQLNHRTVSLKLIFWMILPCAWFMACHKKNDAPIPVEKSSKPGEVAALLPEPVDDSTVLAQSDSTLPVPDSALLRVPVPVPVRALAFSSNPFTKAWVGRLYTYRPTLSLTGRFKLALLNGPDSMRINGDHVEWKPRQAGRYSVVLTATLETPIGREKARQIKQEFSIAVENVLLLAMKPLPLQIKKGDTVPFDLSASTYPGWAANDIKVRFDFEGDGKWDTVLVPGEKMQRVQKAYDIAGKYAPKVTAQYLDLESQTLGGSISVVSAVNAVFKISPDTVEPGGSVLVDASGSKGDGRLVYSLDLNADGTVDWTDSSSGKAKLTAPKSGVYQTILSVRNPMGQEGKATATLYVNAKPKLEVKVRNPKENMRAEVEFRAHAMDEEDSLLGTRINFTGDSAGWISRSNPPDSVIHSRSWLLRYRHSYGKVGKYTATVCIASRDGRETCRQIPIEIFNAPPICKPGPDLHATLGVPISIEGSGTDPDGKIVKWEWDLNGDGKFDLASEASGRFQYTFAKLGTFPMVLRVTSEDGKQATASRKVEVRKKWKA